VCITISEIPGLLAAVVSRMKVTPPHVHVPGNVFCALITWMLTSESFFLYLQDDVDAVRLVNNLAANSETSSQLFVEVDGSVEALKVHNKRSCICDSLPLFIVHS
jgi:hypothetical protein